MCDVAQIKNVWHVTQIKIHKRPNYEQKENYGNDNPSGLGFAFKKREL